MRVTFSAKNDEFQVKSVQCVAVLKSNKRNLVRRGVLHGNESN